jgi:hypothetical protein
VKPVYQTTWCHIPEDQSIVGVNKNRWYNGMEIVTFSFVLNTVESRMAVVLTCTDFIVHVGFEVLTVVVIKKLPSSGI